MVSKSRSALPTPRERSMASNRALLAEVYKATDDLDVKRRVLRAYMVSGDRARVLAAATGEAQDAGRIGRKLTAVVLRAFERTEIEIVPEERG